MTRRFFVFVPCALVALAGTMAHAQGDITDPPALFQRTGSPFDTTPTADFEGVSSSLAQDHLFEDGWWFRVSGDAQEFVFGTPDVQSYVGDTSTVTWNDVAARGLFSAQEIAKVKNTAGPSGFVTQTMTITNLSAVNPLDIDVFHMADIDLAGAGSDSGALLFRQNHMRITDPSGNVAEYRGVGAQAYLVRPFGGTDVGTVLSNAAVDDFNNSGLPFGPGDFTGGFQWTTVTIPPSGSASYTVQIAVNDSFVRGDFDDDAKGDLLFRNSLFTRHVVWTMDGLTRTAGIFVTPDVADTNNRAFCTDDFSGDGRPDILFRNVSTGDVEFWVMGGPTGTDRQSVLPLAGTTPLPLNWIVAACGDVNRDGKADILWRDTAGVHELRVWLMNDNTWVADLTPTPANAIDNNWTVVALLDFNGDGNIDFHWFNETSGFNVQWYMDRDFVRLFGQFTSPTSPGDNNWKVVAAGDYRQGKLGLPPVGAGDLVFRNETSGRIVGWIMDGQASLAVGNTRLEGLFACPTAVGASCDPADPVPPGATSWFIIGPR